MVREREREREGERGRERARERERENIRCSENSLGLSPNYSNNVRAKVNWDGFYISLILNKK